MKNLYKKGHIHSQEIRDKISASRRGIKFSDEQKKKISLNHRKNQTEETRKKISKTLKGKKKSEATKLKMHKYHISSKSHLWKGGATQIGRNIRMSYEYKLWREAVFARDNWTCVWCRFKSKGKKPSDIHADHIKSFALFPELRLAIDNGRTLCIECHKKTDTFLKKDRKMERIIWKKALEEQRKENYPLNPKIRYIDT